MECTRNGDTAEAVSTCNGKMDTFENRQAMVKAVDESTESLMIYFDGLHTGTDVLLQHLEEATEHLGQVSPEAHQKLHKCTRSFQSLIMMLEGPVQLQKKATLESLSRLLRFVLNDTDEISENLTLASSYLKIDDLKKSNVSRLAREENHFKRLVSENDRLRKDVSHYKNYIKDIDKKEESFLKEKQILNDERDKLKTEMKLIKEKNTLLEDETITQTEAIAKKEKENKSLIERLQELQDKHTITIETHEKNITSLRHEKSLLQTEIDDSDKRAENIQEDLKKCQLETTKKEDALRELKSDFEKTKNENDIMISDLVKEKDSLVRKCNDLTLVNDSVRNESNKTNQQNSELRANIVEKEEEIKCLETRLGDKEMSISTDKKQFDQERISLKEENNELEGKFRSCQRQLDEMEKENATLKDRIQSYDIGSQKKEESIKEMETQLAELEKRFHFVQLELESANKENEILSKTIDNLNGQLNDKETIIASLKDCTERMEHNLVKQQEEAKTEQTKLQDQISMLKQQNKNYELDLKKMNAKTHEMEIQITSFKKTSRRLKEENENISKVLVALENELTMIKSKRKLQVQLFSQNRTNLTSSVEHELTKLLKSKLQSEKLILEFVQCAKQSDIQNELPLLLLCITVSRLGTDVANAVQGLTLSSKMAVLIFHHKDVHALPNQASERVLTGQELRSLGGVYDMAFLSDKGIYSCEMNNNNIVSLISFINREGVKKTINE